MRNIPLIIAAAILFSACKKDKYTTVPQISYKSISPLAVSSSGTAGSPRLTLNITDAEGDLGLVSGKDSAWVFVKLLLDNKLDSFLFPNITRAVSKNFQADVVVDLPLRCKPIAGNRRHVDTLFYDVYIKDFARNKSNVIRTNDAVLFDCQ